MRFGNKADPSIVFKYGCRIVEGLALIDEQIFLAHQYRNRIVDLDLERRAAVEEILLALQPRLGPMKKEEEELDKSIQAQRDVIDARRAKERRRVPATVEEREAIAASEKRLRELRAEIKAIRQPLFKTPEFQVRQQPISKAHAETSRQTRAESKLCWGTYLAVEQAMSDVGKGAPPTRKHYRRDGKISVQVQKGLSMEGALTELDRRVQIAPLGTAKGVYRLRLQLGKDKHVVLSFKYHRPMPDDCRIKWVYVMRRMVGTHAKWDVQFVCSRKGGWAKEVGPGGRVAVNLGWRLKSDGAIRAAYWVAEDGHEGEFLLPPEQLGRLTRSEELQSIRDVNFNTCKLQLKSWLATTQLPLPAWLVEESKTLHAWRSQARLAWVAIKWRAERFKGDQQIFDVLEAWRHDDKKDYDRQSFLRRGFQLYRKDAARCFAAQLAREYGELVIGNVKWKDMQDKPKAEEPDDLRLARERKRLTSPYSTQLALEAAFVVTTKIDPNKLTAKCHRCSEETRTPDPLSLMHHCENCGQSFDQDANHCHNLLRSKPDKKSGKADAA